MRSEHLTDVAKVVPRSSPFCTWLRIYVLILETGASNSIEINVGVPIGCHRARYVRLLVELLTDDGHASNAIFQEPESLAVK